MHEQSPMNQVRRCHAKSKRSGKPCQAPAVRGWAVCRMHGAGGGAPLGNKNARKHGLYTAQSITARQDIRALLRDSRDLLKKNIGSPSAVALVGRPSRVGGRV